jgi:hypothetical protein
MTNATLTTTTTPTTNPFRRLYGSLAERRTWKETAGLLVALPLGAVWFSVAVTGLSAAAGLIVTLVGLPLLAATVAFGRVVGAAERAKARAFYDADVPAPQPVARDGTRWVRLKRQMSDRVGWRGVVHSLVALPLGVVWFTATVVVWSVAAYAATFPLHHWWASWDSVQGGARVSAVVGVTIVGLVMLHLAPRIVHAMASADRKVIRWASAD